MTNRYSNLHTIRGRDCIKGPRCQRKCCIPMSNYEYLAQPSSVGTSFERADNNSLDSHTDDKGERNDCENSVNTSSSEQSTDVQGADEIDASTGRFPVMKSSSFPSPHGKPEIEIPFVQGDSLNRNHYSKSLTNLKNRDRTKNSNKHAPDSPTQYVPESAHAPYPSDHTSRSNHHTNFPSGKNILKICAVAVVILVPTLGMWLTNEDYRYTVSNFQDDLNRIVTDYEIRGDTMLKIQTAIKTTFKKEDTTSIVFLYRSMDEERAKEIVRKVAEVSAKFLRNETNSAFPIIVKTSHLNMETSEDLTWKFKRDLEDQGVLLFDSLEDIPVNLAMALHFYCDEYNPLVKKTAIFFTLNLSKCRKKVGKTQHEMTESCLMDKWSSLHEDKLPALLNRVVNVVVDLDTEPTP